MNRKPIPRDEVGWFRSTKPLETPLSPISPLPEDLDFVEDRIRCQSRSRSRSRSSSSSSDSDDYITNRNHRVKPIRMASSLASVEDRNPKMAPTLTPGKIIPETLLRWERACKEFFRVKRIDENKKVESILSRLQDVRIANWAEANEATLKALEFPAFMEKLRERALEKDWDRKIKLSILALKQGERPFHEWAYEIQIRNALLRNRPSHFSDKALRETLENDMDPGLELRVRRAAVANDAPLREWTEKVEIEDELMVREREITKEMVKELYRKERRMGRNPNNRRAMGTRIENTVPTQRVTNTSFYAVPKLTPAERAIIFDHQGCFKCRQLYVYHKGENCPNGFPAPGSYKPLTNEYAEAVRDSKNKPKPRAGHTSTEATEVPSAVLGVGEEDSDESDMM